MKSKIRVINVNNKFYTWGVIGFVLKIWFEKRLIYEESIYELGYYIRPKLVKEKIIDLNDKVPKISIDNPLEEFKEKPIFQNKVDKANEIIKNVGLPKNK